MDAVTAILALPGGWPFAIAAFAGLGILFLRGDIVPRFIFDRAERRAEKAEAQVQRFAEASDRQADAYRELRDEIRFKRRSVE